MPRSRFRGWLVISSALLTLTAACSSASPAPAPPRSDQGVLLEDVDAWLDLYLGVVAHDQWVAPPRVSRDLALLATATREVVALAHADLDPIDADIHGWVPPQPAAGDHDWTIALGAALEVVLVALWSDDYHASLHLSDVEERRSADIDRAVAADADSDEIARSEATGRTVGEAVVTRAELDGFDDVRHRAFEPPAVLGAWERTGALRRPPMEPHWGRLEPWARPIRERCTAPQYVAYSDLAGSDFYTEAAAVHEAATSIGDEGRARVLHWAGEPRRSVTPPGHWMLITRAIVHEHDVAVAEAVDLYWRVAIALNDASIVSWDAKYVTFLLRPETYIQRHIDPEFRPVIATPPFPSFTSGHAAFSWAAADVLTERVGSVGFTDDAGVSFGRPERRYASPAEAAAEAAASRVEGGIHYPMDSQAGRSQGQCVAATHAELFGAPVPSPN